MQPTYLPWLGYFDLIKSADVFVFLDHVQFSKQSWQQRNKIRDKNGELMMVMPVKKGVSKDYRIQDVLIDNTKIPLVKHLKSFKTIYAKSNNFSVVFPELEELFSEKYERLADLNIDLIKYGCKKMNIETEFIKSSSLDVEGSRVEALIDICNKTSANHYHSPVGSKEYIEENNLFESNGIKLTYQEYTHPVYQQINYNDFISHLGFIDFLFNA